MGKYNDILTQGGYKKFAVKYCWSDGCCMIREYSIADDGTTKTTLESPGCSRSISRAEANLHTFDVPYPQKLIIRPKVGTIYVIDMSKETFTSEKPIPEDIELFKKHELTAEDEVPLEED